jgi:hypothetical protein
MSAPSPLRNLRQCRSRFAGIPAVCKKSLRFAASPAKRTCVSGELVIVVVDYESLRIALIESLCSPGYRAPVFNRRKNSLSGMAKDRWLAILG